eukprot:CAMPEP_0206468560 /NCGR_PEP_ID=MMETSP0324_2-20121206/29701_1 /ASSEMBLY_ACC=CAM_ASM_000836 /TAXON_ID=2866 /ORGANISM="Crypthecodinium cohnii, Strain Seligo" /LENGTH=45 /DNA_ID= /DNA_START= /DNA_END= /DNA_ORIENTATION=
MAENNAKRGGGSKEKEPAQKKLKPSPPSLRRARARPPKFSSRRRN